MTIKLEDYLGGKFMIARSNTSKFHLDGVPSLGEAFPLGLQHLLAMFIGNIVPMIVVSQARGLTQAQTTLLIQSAMFGAAISTLIQVYPILIGKSIKIGSGLPVFMGLTYTFLPTCIAVSQTSNLGVIFGAQIIGALASIFFGFGLKKIRKFMPPVVTGSIVISIGISLFPLGIHNVAGGIGSPTYGSLSNWLVGSVVIAVILYFTQFGKGLAKVSSILIGIVTGYALALALKMVDFSAIGGASWVAIPKPLAFGLEWKLDIIILFIVIFFINSIEMVGDYSVSAVGGIGREATDEELTGGIIGNGVSSIIAALFNCFPTGTYSQNSGIVALTKVISRFVIGVGAAILLISSFIPKVGALISTIPSPVVGGATLVVFSMITMSGISLLTMRPLNNRSMLIAGISITLGVGIVPEATSQFPEIFRMFFGESSVVMTATAAFILNLIFPKEAEEVIEEEITEAN